VPGCSEQKNADLFDFLDGSAPPAMHINTLVYRISSASLQRAAAKSGAQDEFFTLVGG
jgi:hypothetical protein